MRPCLGIALRCKSKKLIARIGPVVRWKPKRGRSWSEAVAEDRDHPEPNVAEAIRRRLAPLGGVDLELPPAEFVDAPPSFDP